MNLKIRGTTLWINGKKYCDHIDGGDGIYSNNGMLVPDQPPVCCKCGEAHEPYWTCAEPKEPTHLPNMATLDDVARFTNSAIRRLLESLTTRCAQNISDQCNGTSIYLMADICRAEKQNWKS